MLEELKEIFNILSDAFLNLIYEQECLICGCSKNNELLCKNCAKDVEYFSGFAHKIHDGVLIFSATNYSGVVKELIHKLKFQHKRSASIPLANILYKYFKKMGLSEDFVICYPNTYYLKNLSRGYNHMYLIAKEFSKLTGIKLVKDAVLKTRYTKPQFSVKNKKQNVLDSFQVNPKKLPLLKNKTVLLIDDITTSGATLEELIKSFKSECVQNIICLTVAKTPKLNKLKDKTKSEADKFIEKPKNEYCVVFV